MVGNKAGRWIMWGEGTPSPSLLALMRYAEAAADHASEPSPDEHDCGEGDLSAELNIERYFPLIRDRDPGWRPPKGINSDGTVSWVSVERNMADSEVRAKAAVRGARGFFSIDPT